MESAGILEALHSFSRDLRLRCIRSFFQVHLILHVRRTVISPYFVNASGDEMRKRVYRHSRERQLLILPLPVEEQLR